MEEKGIMQIGFTPAVITADFESMREELERLVGDYADMDDSKLAEYTQKELKEQRAFVRKIITSVEDGRKAVKRQYEEPLKAFEAEVKDILGPAREIDAKFKAAIDRKAEIVKEQRKAALEEYYREIGGVLADNFPFDTVFEDDWIASDAKYKAAFDKLFDKCRQLSADMKSLEKMWGQLHDPNEVQRELFRTLDLKAAIERDEERRAEDARIAALKADMGLPQVEQPSVSNGSAWTEGTVEVIEVGDEVNTYMLFVDMTARQFRELLKWFSKNDIHGRPMKTKYTAWQDAYEETARIAANAMEAKKGNG